MIAYVINFTLCSGLLLLVYHGFLKNENLYRFNRFYLLASLVFSLAVPSIKVKMYPAQTLPIEHYKQENIKLTVPPAQLRYHQSKVRFAQQPVKWEGPKIAHTYYLGYAGAVLYSVVTMLMLFRFTRNLYIISRKTAKSKSQIINGTRVVLVDDDVTPHSFLRYIFINKDEYDDIEPEIICHEQAHTRQLHSLDIIIVELLQVFCWFNPVILFYRKAIQLNHEFLADEAVIKSYDNAPSYQYLLLAKANQLSGLYLSSQFNYSITQKRFIMMTKNTPAVKAWLARLAIIPVLTLTFILFCNKIANAQKLPQIQDVSVRAPDNVKIDGKLNEWPNPYLNASKTDGYLNAYNSTNRIYYTIANDDNNLYIVMRGLGTRVVMKSLSGGFTITISHAVEKKLRAKAVDNVVVTFPIPVDDKTINKVLAPIRGGFNYYNEEEVYPAGYPFTKQLDSIQAISNAIVTPIIKEIKITGVKEIPDSVISVYNDLGIKASMQFTWRQPVYELAIPLKYLKMDINNPEKFSYNIKLNLRAEEHRSHAVEDFPPPMVGGMGMNMVMGTPDPGTMYMMAPTDFWGVYTLAKKP